MSHETYVTIALDNFMGNSLKYLSLERPRALTTANRLSLIIASLLRIVAPPEADIYRRCTLLITLYRPRIALATIVMPCVCIHTRSLHAYTLYALRYGRRYNCEKIAPCFMQSSDSTLHNHVMDHAVFRASRNFIKKSFLR